MLHITITTWCVKCNDISRNTTYCSYTFHGPLTRAREQYIVLQYIEGMDGRVEGIAISNMEGSNSYNSTSYYNILFPSSTTYY